MKKYNKGFTLIELLVVVLIIGILSAIALPQYRKVVEKSRLSKALTTLKNIENSVQRYILEKGDSERIDFDTLDIELPNESPQEYTSDDFDYSILSSPSEGENNNFGLEFSATRHNNLYDLLYDIDIGITIRRCYTRGTPIGEYICEYLESRGWRNCGNTNIC